MPPVMRIQKLKLIESNWTNKIEDLAKALSIRDPSAFKRQADEMRVIAAQIDGLQQDTAMGSQGYATVPKMRRALSVAAAELEGAARSLREWITRVRLEELTYELMQKELMSVRSLAYVFSSIEFAPPVPMERVSRKDEIMRQIEEAEMESKVERQLAAKPTDSNLNNSPPEQKPGAVGDAQLGSLNELFGG